MSTKIILARGLTTGSTVQVGKLRGRVAALAYSPGPWGTCGVAVVTLKNGRRLILDGAREIKVVA